MAKLFRDYSYELSPTANRLLRRVHDVAIACHPLTSEGGHPGPELARRRLNTATLWLAAYQAGLDAACAPAHAADAITDARAVSDHLHVQRRRIDEALQVQAERARLAHGVEARRRAQERDR